jgi:iron complex outermembrane receptor protein
MSEGGYTVLDANARFVSESGKLSVNLWGKNLANKFYYGTKFSNSTSKQILGLPGDPRTHGVTIGYDF